MWRSSLASRLRRTVALHPSLRLCSSKHVRGSSSSNSSVDRNLRGACLAAQGVAIAALRTAQLCSNDGDGAAAAATGGGGGGVREGDEVTVRARVERTRGRGRLAFLHLRQPPLESLQAVCEGKELAAVAKSISPESIVDVTGVVRRAAAPVVSTTCQHLELHVTAMEVVSHAAAPLPFPYHDAHARLDTRLNHRVIDLRTAGMVATARLVSAIGQDFRDELLARDFIEVHTPKLLGAASEGGSSVFEVDYFGRKAYLAQSPQLYKQMLVMGDAMRVFEVGPVFRAESSFTHRHLTEFVGLDGEMVIRESHTEVLDVLEPVMCAILTRLADEQSHLIDVLSTQQQQQQQQQQPESKAETSADTCAGEPPRHVGGGHALRGVSCEVSPECMEALGIVVDGVAAPPRTPSTAATPGRHVDPYHARVGGGSSGRRVLRLTFADAARLLADEGGVDGTTGGGSAAPLDDFTLPQERRLGQLVKARYGVDVYVVDCFPAAARPFYTMPLDAAATAPDAPTRSYDMYLRGEEICSGAQRVHDVALLERRLAQKGVDRAAVQDYVDAFRYGAWPHGGFGLGLERIALFFLGLDDIRQVSLFPRDPRRLRP
ncbi:aspartyl-tRNA synthetase [Novymonas esmeraldas]|uniref:aspartate--tRNA ligase n=1 Tax=Novymonas esmeraldas TaxID=1808958 RepID=A0AAW0F0R2_9TRYP